MKKIDTKLFIPIFAQLIEPRNWQIAVLFEVYWYLLKCVEYFLSFLNTIHACDGESDFIHNLYH